MNIFLVSLGGMASFAGAGWLLYLHRLKQHEGSTRAEFIAHFGASEATPEISGTVYDHFQKLGVWEGFQPKPSDTLEGTYKTVDEDVEDNLKEILQQLGYEMPHSGILSEWLTPLKTLEDVVQFVSWVKSKQNPSVNAR